MSTAFHSWQMRVGKDDDTWSVVRAECRWHASKLGARGVECLPRLVDKISMVELRESHGSLPSQAMCVVLRTWP